jgi:hypothetical protein
MTASPDDDDYTPTAPRARLVFEGGDRPLFVEFDGKRIASRRPDDEAWTILIAGYTVTGGTPVTVYRLEISYSKPVLH